MGLEIETKLSPIVAICTWAGGALPGSVHEAATLLATLFALVIWLKTEWYAPRETDTLPFVSVNENVGHDHEECFHNWSQLSDEEHH